MFDTQVSSAQSSSFSTSFQSKVLFFFGLAVASSALAAYIGLNYLAQFLLASPAIFWVLIIAELALIFTSQWWSQKVPLNYLLFITFTAITGLTIVPLLVNVIAFAGGVDLIIRALAATTLMFTAAAIFGATTSINLSGLRGFLIIGLIGLIITGIAGIFIPWGNTFEMIFSGIGVIIFAGFTMYDFQNIKNYPENMYIQAAIQLYLDIFNLFLYILRLMLAFSRD